jgi:hypothetical protein
MSIYDKSSLVLIPSGTKSGKVFSQKPVSGDGDFTFTRSSAATRVNADGNIEKETQNLLLQSNTFDTTWGKFGTPTLTSGQSGYDGTNDAWLLQNNGSDYIRQDASYGVVTFSIYAKANTGDFIYLFADGVGGRYFNLNSGTLGTEVLSGLIDSKIESAGNGYYRCIIVVPSFSRIRMYASLAQGDTSSVANIYIQDAQLEQGLVARDYIETTTSAVEGGITDNVPRLDYTDSSCPALLLEPQRTNLIDYSEYYDVWLKAGTTPTFTENYGTSPEGLQNSTRVQLDNNELFYRTPNATQGAYVFSVFAKDISGGGSKITLRIDVPATKVATFDLSDGSIDTYSSDNALIEDYGNGWYRCMLIQDNDAIVNAVIAEGDNGLDCEIYGAQLEAGSYATSYIPTYGSSVTRVLDSIETATPSTSLFNQTEGVVYAEWENVSNGNSRLFNLKGGGHQIYIKQFGTSSERIFGVVYNGSSNVFSVSTPTNYLTIGDTYKAALRYKDGEYAFYVNGTQMATSTTTGLGSMAADKIDLENNDNAGSCKHKKVLYFPSTLTNAELADLTTL